MQGREDKAANDLLVLHPDDNIAVLKRPVSRGMLQKTGDRTVIAGATLPMGHKIAIKAIGTGQDIVKYGAVIGFAATDIEPGAHVHIHNLISRYTAVEDMEAPRR